MTEFVFKGEVTLRGVDFFIEAETLEEAVELARRSQFDDCEYGVAEIVDCEIYVKSGEANE